MGLLDDLKKTMAERAAREGAKQAGRSFTAVVERFAGEFLDDAESALEQARAARGLGDADTPEPADGAPDGEAPATVGAPVGAAETPPAAPSYVEQRQARQAAAADELARLKAERDALRRPRTEAGSPGSGRPKKTL